MSAPSPAEYRTQHVVNPDSPSIDEKLKFDSGSSAPSLVAHLIDVPQRDWTDQEERVVRRKLDCTVMPLLILGFFIFQIERGNIANALTSTLLKDVGIDQDQFNTGQGLLYLGIVLLEIPSQVILQRVGPSRWISVQILAFGLVATFQAWMNGYGSYLATRILLGATESGFIPGSLYTISQFYKREELAARNAAFFLGSALASACTGLFAYGILRLDGLHGYAGWQYLFIIEGSIACGIALLFFLLLPASLESPAPFLFPRLPYFTERQKYILRQRVILDDAQKVNSASHLDLRAIWRTLSNWRVWPHVFLAISLIAPIAAFATYVPTLVKSFGFDTLTANALSSVPGWVSLFVIFSFGVISDKTGRRGLTVIAGAAIYWLWWVVMQQVSLGQKKWLKYGFLVLVQGFGMGYHSVNASWLSLNQVTPQERSIAMACFVSAANVGAAVGSQLLRADDSPTYRRGFRICVALVSFGLAITIAQHVQYRLSNRRLEQQRKELGIDTEKADQGLIDAVRRPYCP